jgi:hypothetical protein
MHTEGNDPGRPEGTSPHPPAIRDDEHPGYETQDVNVGGIVTFLAGLAGFVIVFFFFCFAMGKGINYLLAKQDGPQDKWHTDMGEIGETPRGDKRQDLESNFDIQQKQLGQMAQVFPTPRLEADDGNQDLADLHAREDLLLENYSSSGDLPAGTIRIPIDRAMELIVERGLPKATGSAAAKTLMAGESTPVVHAPLTNGFARTGYELKTIEAREERNNFNKAEEHK